MCQRPVSPNQHRYCIDCFLIILWRRHTATQDTHRNVFATNTESTVCDTFDGPHNTFPNLCSLLISIVHVRLHDNFSSATFSITVGVCMCTCCSGRVVYSYTKNPNRRNLPGLLDVADLPHLSIDRIYFPLVLTLTLSACVCDVLIDSFA